MEEWKTYTASEFCFKVTDGTHDSPKPKDSGHYLITSKHLKDNCIDFSSAYKISEEDYQKIIKRSNVVQHDLLFSMIGTIGNVVRVRTPIVDFAVKNMAIFKMGGDELKSKWLYYWLQSHYAKEYIASRLAGSTQAYLTLDSIRQYPVCVPSETEMLRIVEILQSIDDKIELNNRINHNLEQQAQALYKSWFVDFEPFRYGKFVDSVLGLIPEGWQVVNLDSLCSIISRGFAPKYSNSTTDIVLGQRCVRNNMIDLSVSRTHTPKNLGERALRQYDILINSTGMGSLGRVAQIYFKPERMTFDSHLTLVRAKSSILEMYIGRNLLSRQDEIENMAVGSTGQTELPRDSVKNMSILYPCDQALKQFGDCIRAITGRIQSNLTENTELTLLRDKLLPKLMSGELKIDDLTC